MSKALELADDLEKHWNTQAPLAVAAELRRQAAEVQQLTEERTAWRVTAENAEAAVKQAREDALEEAKQSCDVSEPGWTGYECPNTFQDGVRACEVAIESLKGKT